MWFKNLLLYRFTKPFTHNTEALHELLEAKAFRPCNSQELSTFGWVPPIAQGGSEFIHAANGFIMLCAQRQEKVLPVQVINEALEEKVSAIREQDGRKPGRKERTELKEEIIFDLLPRAFTRSNRLYAYIAPREGLLVVNSGSHTKAEELLTYLRETLGSLPVIPVVPKNLPFQLMTRWLTEGSAPGGFSLGGECELRDSADTTSVIRCKNQDLTADEIQNHLKAGMVVTKLAISWQGGVDCIIDEKLSIKRLAFADLIQEKVEQIAADSAAEQFDADFTIMTGELTQFIPSLLQALGGEDQSESSDSASEAAA